MKYRWTHIGPVYTRFGWSNDKCKQALKCSVICQKRGIWSVNATVISLKASWTKDRLLTCQSSIALKQLCKLDLYVQFSGLFFVG